MLSRYSSAMPTGIPHADCRLTSFPPSTDTSTEPPVRLYFDRVLCQIEQQPVQQHITADKLHVFACLRQCVIPFSLCQRVSDRPAPPRPSVQGRYGRARAPIAGRSSQAGAHKRTQALNLLLLKMQQFRSFFAHLPMFCRKELQPCLHQRQRCPQLMGGVSRKLPLCIERLRYSLPSILFTDSLSCRNSAVVSPGRRVSVRLSSLDLFGLLWQNPSAASKPFR